MKPGRGLGSTSRHFSFITAASLLSGLLLFSNWKTQKRCTTPFSAEHLQAAAAAECNAAASVRHACARHWSFEGSWVKRLSGDQSVSSMTLVHTLWRPDIDAVTPSVRDRWFCVTRAINAALTADWSERDLALRKRSTWFIHKGEAKGNSSGFLFYFQMLHCAKKNILVNESGLKTAPEFACATESKNTFYVAKADTGKESNCVKR